MPALIEVIPLDCDQYAANNDQANGNSRPDRTFASSTSRAALAWFVTRPNLSFAFLKQALCERAIYWCFAHQ